MARIKKEDIAEMSIEELKGDIVVRQKLYTDKKFFHSVTPVEDTNEMKDERKNIARLKTELKNRNVEDVMKDNFKKIKTKKEDGVG